MENKYKDTIINILCFALFAALLILICTSISYCIKFNSQDAYALEINSLDAIVQDNVLGLRRFKENITPIATVEVTPSITGEDLFNQYGFEIEGIYIPSDGITLNGLSCIVDTSGGEQLSVLRFTYLEGYEYSATDINTLSNFGVTTFNITSTANSTVDEWLRANTVPVNVNNSITNPYISIDIPTDIQIMENINMDINGFGSTTSNDNVGISALNGGTLGKLRTNDGTLISFNGIAVTSFDSWLPNSTYVYPLTDSVTSTEPFTIKNGLMLYVWDDTRYYQVAWYNPAESLWYIHGDYALTVPYGHRSTTSIGTLAEGIAISLLITPNLTTADIGSVELGGFEDTPPSDNLITVPDEDAYSKFAMFCNANFISDSEKLAWGISQHQSGQNLGQSQQLGDNILGQFLQAPFDILDSIVIYTTPNGTAVTLLGIYSVMLTLMLVVIFLKLFAGG